MAGIRDQFHLLKAPRLFGGSPKLEIALVSDVYTDACDWRGTAVGATTPAAVTTALSAQVGHETVGPTDVTIGGYPASRFEFLFAADFDDDTACDDGTIWLFPGDPDPGIFNFDPGTTMTVYVVDVDGPTVAAAAPSGLRTRPRPTSPRPTHRRFAALRTGRGAGCLALAECVYIAVGGAREQPSPDRTDERHDRAWPLSMDVAGRRCHLRPPGRMGWGRPTGSSRARQRISNLRTTCRAVRTRSPMSTPTPASPRADSNRSPARREFQPNVRGPREPGRHRGRDSWFNGPDGVTDPPLGQMAVSVRNRASTVPRAGMEQRPLQIWADPEETTFFALAPGHWGVAELRRGRHAVRVHC